MKQSRTLSQLGRFLVLLLLAGAFAPLAAPQAIDAWAPQASTPPFALVVTDPGRGLVPFPPVHATLLPDRRVMLFATTGIRQRAAWFVPAPIDQDPPSGIVVLTADNVPVDVDPPISVTDGAGRQWYVEETLFCSGHSLMADGSLFVAGGTLLYSIFDPLAQVTVNYIYGMPNATLYSYPTNTWSRLDNMRGTGAAGQVLRWYGTVTRLADERMLVASGSELAEVQVRRPGQPTEHHPGTHNRSLEIWLPSAVPGGVVSEHAETPSEVWNPDYTHAFQSPYATATNYVLMFGAAGVPVYFTPDGPPGSRWFTLSNMPRPGARSIDPPNHGASSVLLPLRASNFEWGYANGSVMQAGGGRESAMERSIDFFEITSGWAQGIDTGFRRRYPATVLLPDGKVLVVSGYDATGTNPALRNAHYLDPRPPASFSTGTAAMGEVRGYHNVALLLPDGRVFVAGGRSAGEAGPEDEKPSFRYLYPPYMSPRESPPPRPAITAAPATIG